MKHQHDERCTSSLHSLTESSSCPSSYSWSDSTISSNAQRRHHLTSFNRYSNTKKYRHSRSNAVIIVQDVVEEGRGGMFRGRCSVTWYPVENNQKMLAFAKLASEN